MRAAALRDVVFSPGAACTLLGLVLGGTMATLSLTRHDVREFIAETDGRLEMLERHVDPTETVLRRRRQTEDQVTT